MNNGMMILALGAVGLLAFNMFRGRRDGPAPLPGSPQPSEQRELVKDASGQFTRPPASESTMESMDEDQAIIERRRMIGY